MRENQVGLVDPVGTPVGFIAKKTDFINQLYSPPDRQRGELGRLWWILPGEKSPEYLQMYTLQINVQAWALYEKNGFVAEKFDASPLPKSEPDVGYYWRPNR